MESVAFAILPAHCDYESCGFYTQNPFCHLPACPCYCLFTESLLFHEWFTEYKAFCGLTREKGAKQTQLLCMSFLALAKHLCHFCIRSNCIIVAVSHFQHKDISGQMIQFFALTLILLLMTKLVGFTSKLLLFVLFIFIVLAFSHFECIIFILTEMFHCQNSMPHHIPVFFSCLSEKSLSFITNTSILEVDKKTAVKYPQYASHRFSHKCDKMYLDFRG